MNPTFAYAMYSIQEQYSSFLGNLERLPSELLDRILQLSLFSELYGRTDHSVLHMIMLLSQVKSFPHLRRNMTSFMRTEWFRKEIQKQCNLYGDYNSAYQNRQTIPSHCVADLMCRTGEKDLVSWTISECPSCFRFLLYHRTILPSYYNHDGECLLYMALCHRRKRAATILVRSLTIESLASPLWLTCEKVGPSALDIASSDQFVLKRDTPWDYSAEENRNQESDYHSFMYRALRKHPQKRRIGLVYVQHCIGHLP
jgi:hypothetical protein